MFLKRKPTLHEQEQDRIFEGLKSSKVGSDEYERLISELEKMEIIAGKQKERKQFLDKEGKGQIIGKIVGFLGLGALTLGITRYEKKGYLFSGKSNSLIEGIIKIGTRFFG